MAADGTDILSTFACLVFLPILVALVSTVIMGQLPTIDFRKDWEDITLVPTPTNIA